MAASYSDTHPDTMYKLTSFFDRYGKAIIAISALSYVYFVGYSNGADKRNRYWEKIITDSFVDSTYPKIVKNG